MGPRVLHIEGSGVAVDGNRALILADCDVPGASVASGADPLLSLSEIAETGI